MSNPIKPLKVSKLALSEYRKFVIGNSGLTKKEVAKKLTRNVLLAYSMESTDEQYRWYAYGYMRILVKNNKKIISVINRQPTIVGHEIDLQQKEKFEKMLKIT